MLKLALMFLAIIGVLTLTGCQGYQSHGFATSYQFGSYDAAAAQVQSQGGSALKDPGNGDHLIYLLEDGAVRRTQGKIEDSTAALEKADLFFQQLDKKADVRIGRATKAAVSNLGELQYEGTGYDRMMMNTYKALNYMEQGNMDFARAELKRVANVQQMIERRNAERIKEAKAEAARGKIDPNVASDPTLMGKTAQLYPNLPDNRLKSAYVNAYAEWLQGMFLLNAGDAADRETARAALRNTLSMMPNAYVQDDLAAIEAGQFGPTTYVILESGIAPLREECRIDIPIWFFNIAFHDTGVDYVGVAFPKLVPQAGGMPFVQAKTSTGTYASQLLVDMDAVIAREFKDGMPTVITRTILAAAAKATLAYAANKATEGDALLNVVTRVGTTAFQYSVNRADLRTWRTLPKTVSIARFPTPADGNILLSAPQGATVANVKVDPRATNVIWVRAPGDAGGVVCRAFLVGRWAPAIAPVPEAPAGQEPVRAEDVSDKSN